MADIELPRDAVGRGIPPDTTVPFDGNGNAYHIACRAFATDFDLKDGRSDSWRAVTDTNVELDPELMYLTPPGSREKPFEGLNGAVEADDVRMYPSGSGICLNRAIRNTSGGRSPKALGHIPDRIRKPRGEGRMMTVEPCPKRRSTGHPHIETTDDREGSV